MTDAPVPFGSKPDDKDKVWPESHDGAPQESHSVTSDESAGPSRQRRGFWSRLLDPVALIFSRYIFTGLTQRIIFLNMAALFVLLSGILFLNQFRDSLVDSREESLLTQGEIIAAAISARASVDTDSITIDPERLLELQAGESTYPMENELDNLDFPINPEEVAPVLRRLISPTRTRARIYDRDGIIILDSDRLYSSGQILRFDLPPISKKDRGFFEHYWLLFRDWFWQRDLPLYVETPNGNGTAYSEVVTALTGSPGSKTYRTSGGDTVVSVAVPVQRFRAVLGVLLLSTEAGDIDKIIAKERFAIMRTFGVAVVVSALLSILLASTIASPLRRLSAAAERVRIGVKNREQIPDFSERQDEIGHLSSSLRDMTESLYARIDAIERFAADVSHELKNPLTSLRSAVETLPLVKQDAQREKLLEIINHDVRRLDRLISDISDASRLDAELARDDAELIDLDQLLEGYRDTYESISSNAQTPMPALGLHIGGGGISGGGGGGRGGGGHSDGKRNRKPTSWTISGHRGRLGQVIANLVENARSFVPEADGKIDIHLTRDKSMAIIQVADNGPGIPQENAERIFERFYTDRPEGEAFGQNSGLGLSITRQIVEAHGGTITAGNVDPVKGGALFTVKIPLFASNGKNG